MKRSVHGRNKARIEAVSTNACCSHVAKKLTTLGRRPPDGEKWSLRPTAHSRQFF
jgi:hypothetical protein